MGVEYKVILLRLANAKKREQDEKRALNIHQQANNHKRKSLPANSATQLKKQYYFQPFEDWPLG